MKKTTAYPMKARAATSIMMEPVRTNELSCAMLSSLFCCYLEHTVEWNLILSTVIHHQNEARLSEQAREHRDRLAIPHFATPGSLRQGAAPSGLWSEAFRPRRTKAGSTGRGNRPRSRDSQGACAAAWPTGVAAGSAHR